MAPWHYQVPMKEGKTVVFSTISPHSYKEEKGQRITTLHPGCQPIRKYIFLIYKLMNHIAKGSLEQTIKQFQSDFTEQESKTQESLHSLKYS